MNVNQSTPYSGKLRRRKNEIEMTLRYLEAERREVEENTEWLNRAAYESRARLLERLTDWYLNEMQEVDRALGRVTENRYGLCLACHEPIEADRLETYPEAELCFDCQDFHERLKTG
jgi:RNA polymerase-binding transcription factor DksA